jgi:hypothetical protein
MTEQMSCTFERKMLRIIYGPIHEERWHPIWSSEVYNSYKDLHILDNIKIRRLGWEGHFVRTEGEKIPKKGS